MEVIERKNKVAVSANTQVSEFKIAATSKAFRILSSGLYSDKILAIVRELSTNAYDSHVAAGNQDKPFDVHLPDYYNRSFRIRDYGIGLSKEQVTQIYTTYFMSDKTDSNEYVGCLGLGSKSPFSYADSFTVTSYKGGCKYVYSAFINEEGNPALALLNESATTEDDGVAVEIKVNANDSSRFKSSAENVYRWFKVVPNFTNKSVDIKIHKHTPQKSLPAGKDWYFSDCQYAYAVMGNVAYPLTNLPQQTFDNQHYQLVRTPIVINFAIGELDVEASREGLSYDKRTIGHIKLKLNMILKEVETQVSSMVSNAPSMFEAVSAYHAIKNTLGGIQNCIQARYKNEAMPSTWQLNRQNQDNHASIYRYYVSTYSDRLRCDNYIHSIPVDINKEYIIIDDLKRGGKQRIRNYCLEHRGKYFYCIVPDDSKLEFDDLMKRFGVKPDFFQLTSALPKPVYAKRVSRKGNKNDILKFEYTGCKEKSWIEFTEDMETADNGNIIYVPIANYAAIINDKSYDIRAIQNFIEAYEVLEKEKLTVYGIRRAAVEKTIKDENYQLLTDYIVENIGDYSFLNDINEGYYAINSNNHVRIFDKITAKCKKYTKKLQNIKNNLDTLRKKYYNVGRELGFFSKLSILTGNDNSPTTNPKVLQEVENVISEVATVTTPLVVYGINSYNDEIIKETMSYIELITQ